MKRTFILGFATLFLLAGTNLYAEGVNVSGFADIKTILSSDTVAGTTTELKTTATAEVDFEKKIGNSSVRLDLEFPASGAQAAGIATTTNIEQAKFVWGFGENAALTGGVFNSPIGFEKQDAPDKLQTTNGQLFFLRPANLSGFMWSWWSGPAALDIIYANDFRGQATAPAGYDNSIGAQAKLDIKEAALSVGYITSERAKTGPAPTGNGDALNFVASTKIMNTLIAFEFLTDDNNDGWGLTANHTHGPHAVTFRYDAVDNAPTKAEPTSLTLAGLCSMSEVVTIKVEWRQDDPDTTGSKKTDELTLQWVAKF